MHLQRTGRSQTSNLKTFLTWTNLQEFHWYSKLISKVNHQNSVGQLQKIIYYFMITLPISKLKSQKYIYNDKIFLHLIQVMMFYKLMSNVKSQKSIIRYTLKQTSHSQNSNLKKSLYINKTFVHVI